MSKKILFFDIDGTLLDGGVNGGIPESAIESLKQAQANGHYLFINSGRTSGFMPKAIREFPFDGFLCGCGIEVIFRGKSIYHHKMSRETIDKLLFALEKTGVQALLEGTNCCYCNREIDNVYEPVNKLCEAYEGETSPYPIYSFSEPDMDFDKFVAFHKTQEQIDEFVELLKDEFEYIPRENFGEYYFSEFIPKGHSKATGIDYIVNYLGLSHDDTYAFGDSNNDLPMLSHAKYSIAMGNSYPEVFPLVNYVTTPINRDGIKLALKHYKLI